MIKVPIVLTLMVMCNAKLTELPLVQIGQLAAYSKIMVESYRSYLTLNSTVSPELYRDMYSKSLESALYATSIGIASTTGILGVYACSYSISFTFAAIHGILALLIKKTLNSIEHAPTSFKYAPIDPGGWRYWVDDKILATQYLVTLFPLLMVLCMLVVFKARNKIITGVIFAIALDIAISLTLTKLHHIIVEKEIEISKYNQLVSSFNAECLWHNIPIQRQLFMESVALIKDVLFMEGWRSLSVEKGSGILISDPICRSYMDKLDRQLIMVDPSKVLIISYLGYIKSLVDYIIFEMSYFYISIFLVVGLIVKKLIKR